MFDEGWEKAWRTQASSAKCTNTGISHQEKETRPPIWFVILFLISKEEEQPGLHSITLSVSLSISADSKVVSLAAPPQLKGNTSSPQLNQAEGIRAAPGHCRKPHQVVPGKEDDHPSGPFHSLRLLHANPLMGFKVLLGESI